MLQAKVPSSGKCQGAGDETAAFVPDLQVAKEETADANCSVIELEQNDNHEKKKVKTKNQVKKN